MTIGARGIAQVVVFVDEPSVSARFWADLLGAPHRLADGGALLELPFAEVYFHPADRELTSSGEEKNPHGASTVVYLAVDELEAARERLLAAGCEAWRGPLQIEEGRTICQVRDPFGTVWGSTAREPVARSPTGSSSTTTSPGSTVRQCTTSSPTTRTGRRDGHAMSRTS